MEFKYEAVDAQGRVLRGQLAAGSERELIQVLRGQQLTPISFTAASVRSSQERWRGARVGPVERAQLVRELATLIGAGVSLAEAVESTAEAHQQTDLGSALAAVMDRLREGQSFTDSMRVSGLQLPEYVLQFASAGETTGKLDTALLSAADQMDYEIRVRTELRNALIYPGILVLSGIAATLLIFVIVVPKFAGMLKGSRGNLPEISVWVLKTGLFLQENLLLVALSAAGLLTALTLAMSVPAVRRSLRSGAAKLPLVGSWLRDAELGRWASMLGSLLANRVPIVRAMELAKAAVQLESLSSRLELAVRDLRSGKKLADALAVHRTVGPMGINLVRVGERTGQLPEMLRTLGRVLESASRERMKRFLIIFEPLAILIVGSVIGFIMVAVMMAITSFSTNTL
ncbi:MAG: type II secretion system F family protein [Rhodoferax sp.]|nr:type II secretion system F family protein [Rhodoferax sp.]